MVATFLREIAGRFICILKHVNTYNFVGGVESTTFCTLEFSSWQEAEDYYNSGKTTGGEYKTYTHIGNLFNDYDSYSCREDFMRIKTTQKKGFIYEHWNEVKAA